MSHETWTFISGIDMGFCLGILVWACMELFLSLETGKALKDFRVRSEEFAIRLEEFRLRSEEFTILSDTFAKKFELANRDSARNDEIVH